MMPIWLPLILAAAGLFLSAFFSGSETGFYRVSRVRLMLDAMGGDMIARGLLWLTNRASLFVATTLVGNNLANYVTSLAIVMVAENITNGRGHTVQLIAPILLSPILFVYGELLPKHLFLRAPNRLLRRGGPLFLICTGLFFPISVLLWGLNLLLARVIGESPQQVRFTLARRELQRVLEEGHEAGILRLAQRRLARGIFAVAKQPVRQFATRLRDVARARNDMDRQEVLRLARHFKLSAVPVEDAKSPGRLIGYVRVIELALESGDWLDRVLPLMKIRENETHLTSLIRMQTAKATLAVVLDVEENVVGLLTARRLRDPLVGRRS